MAGCVAGRGAHSSPSHRARGRPPAGFPRAAPPPGLAPAGPPGTPPARTPPSPGSPTSASSREPLFSSRAGPSGLRALGLLSSVWPTPALLTVSFPELSHRLFFPASPAPVGCTMVHRCGTDAFGCYFPGYSACAKLGCRLPPGEAHTVTLGASG